MRQEVVSYERRYVRQWIISVFHSQLSYWLQKGIIAKLRACSTVVNQARLISYLILLYSIWAVLALVRTVVQIVSAVILTTLGGATVLPGRTSKVATRHNRMCKNICFHSRVVFCYTSPIAHWVTLHFSTNLENIRVRKLHLSIAILTYLYFSLC